MTNSIRWLAVAALLAATACEGSYSSPEGTVRTWLDALDARDTAAVHDAFTDRTRELVVEIETLSREAEAASGQPGITVEDWCTAFCGAAVEGSTLHGDSATVEIRVEDDVNEIPVLRQGDEWKIDLGGRLEPAVQMLRLAVRQTPTDTAPADSLAADATPADAAPADTAADPVVEPESP